MRTPQLGSVQGGSEFMLPSLTTRSKRLAWAVLVVAQVLLLEHASTVLNLHPRVSTHVTCTRVPVVRGRP